MRRCGRSNHVDNAGDEDQRAGDQGDAQAAAFRGRTARRLIRFPSPLQCCRLDRIHLRSRDRRDQAVAGLRNRLDDVWLLRIVLEQPAQLGDRTGEDIVADRGVGPRRAEQPLLRHHLPGVLGQTHEDQHHLGFEASDAVRAGHAVERRLDVIGLADPKGLLQGLLDGAAMITPARSPSSLRAELT